LRGDDVNESRPSFEAGRNIAMKLPLRAYDATLAFYRDTLGLPVRRESESGAVVEFGSMTLWLDRIAGQSQTDLWLEVTAPDTEAAARYLRARGVTICNEVEALPEGFDGFWIAAPSGTIHLVAGPAAAPAELED
jgi:catechol 2,3-dioxygenase-like lactoylglutathione lyase family enzyme